eukprot:TRINITY_DN6_c0_g3_i1.p1 TRINITY_DN6_c0_g3~~TRINITY_DN6_c0_g3_i1.p1  ORF type:complete len:534 (+),score=186.18 TRINITY_DN6_c0_g3_i1:110-1711(+)
MMKVLFVLALLVALVFTQTSNIDTLSGVSNKLEVAGTSSETKFESTSQSDILGGERDMILEGTGEGSSSNCESETFIENGEWFANNGQTCSAKAVLQYDGVDGSSNRALGLGFNLNNAGAAFLVKIQTDLPTSFTIGLYSSGGQSTFTENIQASSNLVDHVINYGQFGGNADFSNIGAIELEIAATINTDVIVTFFGIISNEISGRVFSDCNCNAVQDTEDFGVSGITVTATPGSGCASGTSTQTISTNSDGSYTLTGLAACTYAVSISSANNPCNGANSINSDASSDPTNVNFSLEQAGSFTVPADTSISCTQLVNGSPPTSLTGEAVGGGCGGSGTISFDDSEISRVCGGSFVVNRRWFSGGEEGFQVITVTDSGASPVLSIPSTANVQCNGDTSTDSLGFATATDDCSTSVDVQFVDSETVACNEELCVSTRTIQRTWTAVDDCGNQASSQTQTINVAACTGGEVPTCPTPPPSTDDDECYIPSYDDDLCICPVGDDDDDDFGSCQYESSSSATSIVISFALLAIMFLLH